MGLSYQVYISVVLIGKSLGKIFTQLLFKCSCGQKKKVVIILKTVLVMNGEQCDLRCPAE